MDAAPPAASTDSPASALPSAAPPVPSAPAVAVPHSAQNCSRTSTPADAKAPHAFRATRECRIRCDRARQHAASSATGAPSFGPPAMRRIRASASARSGASRHRLRRAGTSPARSSRPPGLRRLRSRHASREGGSARAEMFSSRSARAAAGAGAARVSVAGHSSPCVPSDDRKASASAIGSGRGAQWCPAFISILNSSRFTETG
mmetsp:Transcript_18395/g.28161  ORF Transcript_18395/g.28161 Transcript_18395/m.28161 type:complete len:204 (+) Transcript_18395:566-1177(+)